MATVTAHPVILVADEAWVALALLHTEHPERASFAPGEIRSRVQVEDIAGEVRAGIPTHISQHNVANVSPTSATYRMFYRMPDGTYRLFLAGDECHPRRKGKILPLRSELPESYHYLLDWYEREYCRPSASPAADPVLAMAGVGKEIWSGECGDVFIDRLRNAWPEGAEPLERKEKVDDRSHSEVWNRIVAHQREQFHTISGLPFTYNVDRQHGIWFYRKGKRVEMKLWRGQVEQAISRCPLAGPAEIKDLRDNAYLYGLLMDPRIRGEDW